MNHEITLMKALAPRLIQAVAEHTGVVIDSNKLVSLSYFLQQSCLKLAISPEEFVAELERSKPPAPLYNELIPHLMVGESYFFRDKRQINLLKDSLLPALIDSKQDDKSLRIWSAGSANGEEIYTIALLLHELLPKIDSWHLHLLGTDINQQSIHAARAGYYRANAMRTMPDYFLQKYFIRDEQGFQLQPKIRDLVKFQYLNLVDNQYPSILNGTTTVDLILCRNVLIYFDEKHINHVMQRLSQCLTERGTLILGASDPIHLDNTGLITHLDETTYFTRTLSEGHGS